MNEITAIEFYKTWEEICRTQDDFLFENLHLSTPYTNRILKDENSIIKSLANQFKILYYREYNKRDAVFYHKEDNIQNLPNEDWIQLRRIRVVFEHEHQFSKSFQEISQLILTNADLRVLVTYPDCNEEDTEKTLKSYEEIISYNPRIENNSVLLILGRKNANANRIEWQGYSFANKKWLYLKN